MISKDFSIIDTIYSKKLSECKSGSIVANKEKRILIINAPQFFDKEEKFFLHALENMRFFNKSINTKADVYFFLKEFCIENMVLLNKDQREKILLLLEWESIGESIITPLLADPEFEEIVINGPKKPIMVYHQTFGWLTTNIMFENEEKIRTIINKMAAPLGRQLSYHSPMLNAVLKDGSRLNASQNPIAFSGINATIRKFKETPFTPADLAKNKTISFEAMAFLWAAMQASFSILICGNTGSGKTTTLNSLFCFLPKHERIVVAEETPELSLPQSHTIKLNTAEQMNITLGSLIENTFRMRPDRVIVGEIRTKDEATAFINTMLAGQAKGSYATFHAESAHEAILRLASFGIDESTLASIDLIVVQKRIGIIEHGSRKEERRVTQICEIEKNNSIIAARKLFDYDYKKRRLIKVAEPTKSLEKICQTFRCKEKAAQKIIDSKKELLQKLAQTANFMEFFEIAENEL